MDEVLAECSDGEELERTGVRGNKTWCPKLDEVEALYQRLKNEKVLEFQWKCQGRRNPNEEQRVMVESEKPVVEAMNVSGAYDFDFDDDDDMPTPQKLPSKSNTPKGANKKRTTTLAGIVANMEKHRIMDKMGTESPSKSSNN